MNAIDGSRIAPHHSEDSRRSPRRIIANLRAGVNPTDHSFDLFLPPDLRAHSEQHWTPLHVAALAARWLRDAGARTVIDIGSGAGKFCVVGALLCPARFFGLEQRPRLIEVSRRLARDFGVEDRVEFIAGMVGEVGLPTVDAYYFYNPFAENVADSCDRIDGDVELSPERFVRDIKALKVLLGQVPARRYVIAYHGFGGYMPAEYEEVRVAQSLFGSLRMWWKSGDVAASERKRREEGLGKVLPDSDD